MLAEHKDAKHVGRHNLDMGFGILLVHLNAAYKHLDRHLNRGAAKAGSTAFDASHAAMTKALDRYDAIKNGSDRAKSKGAYNRLVADRQDAMSAANRKLVAAKAQDVQQLAGKIDTLWRLYVSDCRDEAQAIDFAEFGEREWLLLMSLSRM